MSMNKAIKHNKEHRKPYYNSKAICKSCRNHGGCEWCIENRQYKYLKKISACELEIKEYKKTIDKL